MKPKFSNRTGEMRPVTPGQVMQPLPTYHMNFHLTAPLTTDFASRNQGRTTGRMVGHEPGTEGI